MIKGLINRLATPGSFLCSKTRATRRPQVFRISPGGISRAISARRIIAAGRRRNESTVLSLACNSSTWRRMKLCNSRIPPILSVSASLFYFSRASFTSLNTKYEQTRNCKWKRNICSRLGVIFFFFASSSCASVAVLNRHSLERILPK